MVVESAFDKRKEFVEAVYRERQHQIEKWGDTQKDGLYPSILGEEVGECHKAWLEEDTGLAMELIQVAAVCMAWFEQLLAASEGGEDGEV